MVDVSVSSDELNSVLDSSDFGTDELLGVVDSIELYAFETNVRNGLARC